MSQRVRKANSKFCTVRVWNKENQENIVIHLPRSSFQVNSRSRFPHKSASPKQSQKRTREIIKCKKPLRLLLWNCGASSCLRVSGAAHIPDPARSDRPSDPHRRFEKVREQYAARTRKTKKIITHAMPDASWNYLEMPFPP